MTTPYSFEALQAGTPHITFAHEYRRIREKHDDYMLDLWEASHPAVGGSTEDEHRAKWRIRERHRAELYAATGADLQAILIPYVAAIAEDILYNKRAGGKSVRLVGRSYTQMMTGLMILGNRKPFRITPNGWPMEWQLGYIKPIESFDLINRNEFMEAASYTNIIPLVNHIDLPTVEPASAEEALAIARKGYM